MIRKSTFGKMPNNQEVYLFTLKNQNGVEVDVINYGATIVAFRIPTKSGNIDDIVLGYDSLDGYISGGSFFGAICGRYANRISGSKFNIDGSEYSVTKNEGENQLHGGNVGFDKVYWNTEEYGSDEGEAIKLKYNSKDGEEGYPGNLEVEVIYILTKNNELKIEYFAQTDKTTHVNLTNHSYFNLSGHKHSSILGHKLSINADKITENGEGNIPTGKLLDVTNTPFDFRNLKLVGDQIDDENDISKIASGYDQNWVLNNYDSQLKVVAELVEPISERKLIVSTDQPGFQFYTGNFIDGTVIGKDGVNYQKRCGLCLEAQHFPDSPNNANFPSTLLSPGEINRQTTIYKIVFK